jgi:hypothetical protein
MVKEKDVSSVVRSKDGRSMVSGKQRRRKEDETKGDVQCGEVSRQERAVSLSARRSEVKKSKLKLLHCRLE